MKKNTFISIALIGGLALLSSACVKEITSNEDQFRPAGTQIPISAATGYDNGVETRAEYSGELFGSSPTYERIDWVEDDPICVVYNGTASYYTVGTTITAQNEISKTDLDGDLSWDGSGNHTFFALYPAAESGTNGSLTTAGVVTGSIPATQDVTSKMLTNITDPVSMITYDKYQPDTENYGYLVAHETVTGSNSDPSVVLHFKPAVTTFEFKFKRNSGDPDGKVMSAELEAEKIEVESQTVHTPLTGGFSFKILSHDGRGATWNKALTGQDPTTLTSPGYKITVGFGANGVNIPDNSYLDFSILALPIDLTGVKITLNYAGGAKRVLRFKDSATSWHTFTGAKKYIITNDAPSGEWKYVIEEIDDIVTYGHDPVSGLGYNVKSYRYNELIGDSVKEAVRWKTQYTLDDGANWTDLTSSGIHPAGTSASTVFNVNNLTGNGVNQGVSGVPDSYSAGEDRTASIAGISNFQEYGSPDDPAGAAAAAILRNATPRGTTEAPFDLSRHPSYNIDRVVSQTTANSYVVSAPGVYMFPCVYGNAITNGQDNKAAYWPSQASDPVTGESFSTLSGVQTNKNVDNNYWVYYTPRFYNAVNNPITSPYIMTDLGITAASTTAQVVWQDTSVGDEIIPYTPGNIGMTVVDGVDYIWFKIDVANIKPGNIVIGLKAAAICWSWHIWVTEKDLTPTANDVVSNEAGNYTLMPYNLGWVDTVAGRVRIYDNRSIRYRLIQVDSNNNIISVGDNEEFSVTQIGDSDQSESSIGNNPYYQWGRKDPMIPTLSDSMTKPVSPNPDYAGIASFTTIIPARVIDGTSTNYMNGIQQPWQPFCNLIDADGHGATGWVGGTYYPWYTSAANGNLTLTKVDRGPYLFGQANTLNDAHVTVPASWYQNPDNGHYYVLQNGTYVTGSHSFEDLNYLLKIDRQAHFDLPDITAIGMYGSTAAQRSMSSTPANLWNSYAYQENLPYGDENKFKTVYDPCPPGFTVPSKQVFVGNIAPGYMQRPDPTNFVYKSTSPSQVSSVVTPITGIGVRFGSIFFPFTGARTYYTERVGGAISCSLRSAGHGSYGIYWSDSSFQADVADPRSPQGNHNFAEVNSFSYHHSAYMLVFTSSTNEGQSYTRGSAGSIRPMVDPKYNNN